MARPAKLRKICEMPTYRNFGAKGYRARNNESIIMTVDEFEAIRLIDYEDMTQEECALHMNVARTTAQKIYNSARKKIAMMFVQGDDLRLEGGKFELCQERALGSRCANCQRKQADRENER